MNWKVHVANKKGAWVHFRSRFSKTRWTLRNYNKERDSKEWLQDRSEADSYTNARDWLIIDSKEQTIQGVGAQPVPLKGEFWGSKGSSTSVQLGELRTDEQGRLLVLASDGHSASILGNENLTDDFDNDDWVDTMCDGTVHVTVNSKSHPEKEIPTRNRATIITAPPRFSSGTHAPTTLYELIEEMYERLRRHDDNYKVEKPDYYRDIYPLFKRIYLLSWTSQDASDGHGPERMKEVSNDGDLSNPRADNRARADLFRRIRAPVIDGDQANEQTRNKQARERFMPKLSGDAGAFRTNVRDSWLSLTQLQYDRLKEWSQPGPEEHFTTEPEVRYESFDKIPLDKQPGALTQAALEWSIGGAFFPGIETFWIAHEDDKYKPAKPDQPGDRFRFADTVTPGDLTKGLCLPWQSDFYLCQSYWWPSVRPGQVITEYTFQQKQKDFSPNDLAAQFHEGDRSDWVRGINSTSQMVKQWTKLGFVARQPYETAPDQLEIHVEKQRGTDLPL